MYSLHMIIKNEIFLVLVSVISVLISASSYLDSLFSSNGGLPRLGIEFIISSALTFHPIYRDMLREPC